MAAERSPCRCFLRQEFCISGLKYTVKRQKMERESSKECSFFFLWRKGSFSSRNRFRGIQPCFLHGGAYGLQPSQRRFC